MDKKISAEAECPQGSESLVEKEKSADNLLGKSPILRLLVRMALPTMLSMFIQSMYNIVDSIFVARLGEEQLNAVSLIYPLQNLVLAVAVGAGVGLNSCISRALGAKRKDSANAYATHGFVLSGIHSVVFLLLGAFFIRPFLSLFTNDAEIMQYGISYGTIVVGCAVFSLVHISVEKLFQATGNTTFPMLMQALGAVINLILDPLLIYGIWIFPEMGVTGAAVATVIGQACACAVSLLWFFLKGNGLKVRFRGYRPNGKEIRAIYAVAVPSALMMAMPSVLVGIMNAILDTVSDSAVNFFGIYYKLQTLVYVPASGLVQGMRPIVGYNHGAGEYKRMHETVKWSILIVGAFCVLGTLIFQLFPKQILALFGNDSNIQKIGVSALRILSSGFIVSTFGVILSGVFEALGMGIKSLLITVIRQFIFIPTLSLCFMPLWGLSGAWITYPISEFLAAVFAIFIYLKFYSHCKKDLEPSSEKN